MTKIITKINCWEHEQCGREPGGAKVHEMGVCPAATMKKADGFCGGKNGGRACLYIAGTYCSGTLQGDYESKKKSCAKCDFHKLLREEERAKSFILAFNKYIEGKEPNSQKINCWEYEQCGREPGGAKVHEMGVCPAATMEEADGFCGGKNGGRGCAYISNTYCHGIKQGSYQEKLEHCFKCDFYKLLQKEECTESTVIEFKKHIKKNKK